MQTQIATPTLSNLQELIAMGERTAFFYGTSCLPRLSQGSMANSLHCRHFSKSIVSTGSKSKALIYSSADGPRSPLSRVLWPFRRLGRSFQIQACCLPLDQACNTSRLLPPQGRKGRLSRNHPRKRSHCARDLRDWPYRT